MNKKEESDSVAASVPARHLLQPGDNESTAYQGRGLTFFLRYPGYWEWLDAENELRAKLLRSPSLDD